MPYVIENLTQYDISDDEVATLGMPRPIITVVENGTEERWSVTRVEAVLRR